MQLGAPKSPERKKWGIFSAYEIHSHINYQPVSPSDEGDHQNYGPQSGSSSSVVSSSSSRKLGLTALVVLIYYEVSGGPFGIEDIVRAGGPFYAIAGFSLLLVWAVPEALITAELSTAMPESSGAVGEIEGRLRNN